MAGNAWRGPKVVIYLTAEEKDELNRARVKAGGEPMSKFLKDLCLRSIPKPLHVRVGSLSEAPEKSQGSEKAKKSA